MGTQPAKVLEERKRRPLPLGKGTIIGASQRMLSILLLIGAEGTGRGEEEEASRDFDL